jgi:hypothetical protein
MGKVNITDADCLDGLAARIARAWDAFDHSYLIKKRGKPKKGESTTVPWKCGSLQEACEQYEFKGKNRGETNEIIGRLSDKLRAEVKSEDPDSHALHHLCLEVLEWGGVEGASSKWLRENCRDKLLHRQIQAAVRLLANAASEAEFTPFEGSNLVMNSGLTKVYALASPSDVIIYDGRIGAAMGLFVRQYLQDGHPTQPMFPCGRELSAVPSVLQFPWGDGLATEGSRNPSIGAYKFPPLRAAAHLAHACACWKASKVLRLALKKITLHAHTVTLRDLEMALFMVGYHVA